MNVASYPKILAVVCVLYKHKDVIVEALLKVMDKDDKKMLSHFFDDGIFKEKS